MYGFLPETGFCSQAMASLLLEVTSEVKWVRHALEQVIPSEVEGCSLDSEEEVAFSPPEVCQASVQVVEGCPSRLGLLDHRG